MNMKTKRMMLSVLLTVVVCTQVAGQGFRRETFPEGSYSPVTNVNRNVVQKMRDGGVEVRFNSYPGDHEWQVWRKSLHEFAQYLFK